MIHILLRTICWIWASPNTLLGMTAGLVALASGGTVQVRRGVVEFHGGLLETLFGRLMNGSIIAMTLGHTILGRTSVALDLARDHEHVHVRQYERWGPFFLPAYGLFSLAAWWRGGRAYRDNRFEREAYGTTDIFPGD